MRTIEERVDELKDIKLLVHDCISALEGGQELDSSQISFMNSIGVE